MAKKKMERPHIGRCVSITGNLAAGIVLYRLIFWKPTRSINGRMMFAKPRSELEFETGLTGKQVENALSRLRKLGYIVTGQHLFHGRNVMHVAVTAACHTALETVAQSPQMGAHSPPELVDPVPPNEGTSYTSYKQGDHQGGQQEECEQALTGDTGGSGELFAEGKTEVKKVRPSKVEDALKQLASGSTSSPGAGKKLHKPDTSKALELLWVQTVSEATGKYVAPLTMKEIGFLSHIRSKCPKGKAGDVIRFAVSNWIAFVKAVETEAGIKTTPSEPKLQFLLLHVAIAVNMMAPPKPKPKVKQEAKPVALKPKTHVQLISQDEDAPLSSEEVLKLLEDD